MIQIKTDSGLYKYELMGKDLINRSDSRLQEITTISSKKMTEVITSPTTSPVTPITPISDAKKKEIISNDNDSTETIETEIGDNEGPSLDLGNVKKEELMKLLIKTKKEQMALEDLWKHAGSDPTELKLFIEHKKKKEKADEEHIRQHFPKLIENLAFQTGLSSDKKGIDSITKLMESVLKSGPEARKGLKTMVELVSMSNDTSVQNLKTTEMKFLEQQKENQRLMEEKKKNGTNKRKAEAESTIDTTEVITPEEALKKIAEIYDKIGKQEKKKNL